MGDVVTKLLDAAPLWLHVIDALLVLCGLSALLAAVLPKSNKPWRKVVDFLAANFGNARNLWSIAHGKPAAALNEEEPKAPVKKTVKDALDKKSVLDERL